MTSNLGGLFASGIREGFAQAVEQLGLESLLGQDVQTVLAAFTELLAPDGALLEEAAARNALVETLGTIFERYDVDGAGIDALNHMDAGALGELIELSIVNYVNARMQQELANRVERGTLPEADANQLMDQIQGFISEIIKLDFAGIDLVRVDWRGVEGQRIVSGLYEEAYRLLGEDT